MKNTIPNGPWQNPIIDNGLYDAKIAHVVKGVYGKAEHPYLIATARPWSTGAG